jgi:UDP-2-acetamido-3-amino-2,3-dideoxy-glucuronate N-acetyltransferase
MFNKRFKVYKNSTGLLVPISLKADIPFKPSRVFIIHGKKNSIRGDHAHYKCSQFLIPLSGSMTVEYENKKGKFNKMLSFNKNNYLLLKPKTWCKIKFNTKISKLMVFCDKEYDFSDYIEKYNEFLDIIKK